MRKTPLVEGEYYHVFNRGTDKRRIFQDKQDLDRFLQSIKEFNSIKPIGSIFENSFDGESKHMSKKEKLVEVIAYCLNPNHFHLILKQSANNGISEFMKRLSGGYTWYFNNKHKRSGVLFQGKFKSIHIDSDTYLLHVSAYINLNNRFKNKEIMLSKSSWGEYVGEEKEGFCSKEIILKQFKNIKEYKKFALSSLEDIVRRKEQMKDLDDFEINLELGGRTAK